MIPTGNRLFSSSSGQSVRWWMMAGVVFGAVTAILLFAPLPAISEPFEFAEGLHVVRQPFASNPQPAPTLDEFVAQRFGRAAITVGDDLDWSVSTPAFDRPRDFYAFAYVNAPDLHINDFFFFDPQGPHPMSTYGALPYSEGVLALDHDLLFIDDFGPFPPDFQILFAVALVEPGEDLLDLNNVHLWWVQATGLGWCYQTRSCSGSPISILMVDRDTCDALDGDSWEDHSTGNCLRP